MTFKASVLVPLIEQGVCIGNGSLKRISPMLLHSGEIASLRGRRRGRRVRFTHPALVQRLSQYKSMNGWKSKTESDITSTVWSLIL